MTSMIAIRVNDKEKKAIAEVSKLNNCGISSWIKKIIFEKLEDEYDLRIIKEYEKNKSKGLIKLKSIKKLFDEEGI